MPTVPVSAFNISTASAHVYLNTPPTKPAPAPTPQVLNGTVQSSNPPQQMAEMLGPGGGAGALVGEKMSTASDRHDFVFCDPVAFRFLEEDKCTTVKDRNAKLEGYEVYLVEQWACSRKQHTFVISTYTGDASHVVSVFVLSIPRNEEHWSYRLKAYFMAVQEYHARPKETPLGTMLVTNLSSFPSALTVVPVPDGDVRKHREDFIVNENLKRMGCLGRSALSLSKPTDASQTKFHQLFRTSDRIPFCDAVIELVRLCQFALTLFDKLESRYVDGLLCDITERAINDWWTEFGNDFYNLEPNDGILGPTTVAALLGMVMGARNRLSSCGAPAPKDPFDIQQLKKAISQFQKQRGIKKSRRLDRDTIELLQKLTTKSGSGGGPGDIFAVPRAIKSTVVDLSGRAVGNTSGKVEPNSVETTDIEKFTQHLTGERSKYLWHGKPRKNVTSSVASQGTPTGSRRNSIAGTGGSISDNDPHAMIRNSSEITSSATSSPNHSGISPLGGLGISIGESKEKDSTGVSDLRKAVFKTMTGKMKDVAFGISAGADYVRGRGHQRTVTKEFGSIGTEMEDPIGFGGHAASESAPVLAISTVKATTAPSSPRMDLESPTTPILKGYIESPIGSTGNLMAGLEASKDNSAMITSNTSVAGSVAREEITEPRYSRVEERKEGEDLEQRALRRDVERVLKRCKSFSTVLDRNYGFRHDEFWPRRLSFGDVEEAVLDWDFGDYDNGEDVLPPMFTRELAETVEHTMGEWLGRKVTTMDNLNQHMAENLDKMREMFETNDEIVHSMDHSGRDLLERKTMELREAVKEVEMLGARLQYELGSVLGKVEDVEEAVAGFGRMVEEVEEKVQGMVEAGEDVEKKRWWEWVSNVMVRAER
ncbi:hypothetical protein RUND412_009927 [Rhizina undulata]